MIRDIARFDPGCYDPPLDCLIARLGEFKSAAIVGIDGGMAAGKSWLGQWLATRFGWEDVELDDELPGDGNWYQPELAREKVDRLRQGCKSAVVEGICLLDGVPREALDCLVFLQFDPPDRCVGTLQKKVEHYLLSNNPKNISDFVFRTG